MKPLSEAKNKQQLEIVVYPDKFLRFVAQDFTPDQIRTPLVRNMTGAMIRTMYKYNGVGLAAQQVGIPQRVFVMDSAWNYRGTRIPRVFYNPRVIEHDPEIIALNHPGEGCLSLPYGFRSPVRRYENIHLEWLDHKGETQEEWFTGFDAIVVQHELDHLDGHVFTDRLSRIKRDMFKRRWKKVRRQYEKGYKHMVREMKNAPRTPAFALKRWQMIEAQDRARKAANAQSQAQVSE